MSGPSIIKTPWTLAAGASQHFPKGGEEIFLRKLEGASEIEIGLDDGELLPIAAGEGFAATHRKFRINNPNAVPVVVTVLQSTERGVYIDRRDTATSVSIGGSFAVVNSASIDDGGSVRELGGSYASVGIDRTGLAAAAVDLIPAASNLNGIRVRSLRWVWTNVASNGTRQLTVTPNGWRHRYRYYKTPDHDFTDEHYEECFDLPPGKGLAFDVRADDIVTAVVFYDIL